MGGGGGGKNFWKVFGWGVGVRNFYFNRGLYCLGGHGILKENFKKILKIKTSSVYFWCSRNTPNMFYQVLHIMIFSFSFYFSNMASVIVLSILYVKHKHNNQQCNIKVTMGKKDSNPC